VLFGVDEGTAGETGMSLIGSFSHRIGPGEGRFTGSFVQPFVSSNVETYDTTPTAKEVFDEVQYTVVTGVDYCYGLDRGRWISACGGLELGLINTLHEGEESFSPTKWHVGFGPTFGALFVLRRGLFQPELLAMASMPVVGEGRIGGPFGPSAAALRLSAGISLNF
jgi:hypothetical protein